LRNQWGVYNARLKRKHRRNYILPHVTMYIETRESKKLKKMEGKIHAKI